MLKRILILEDDLEALSKIFEKLFRLEKRHSIDISVVILSEYTQAEKLNLSDEKFDLILLDRDCKAGGSFHILDIKKFGADKIIAISSVPDYNEKLFDQGITKVVQKTYNDLDDFAERLIKVIEKFFFTIR